ncbi:MAG: hypothetical protein II886_13180 [Prevotella sp.]|nr:hypothetical protein [Prevotella sp.]
MSTFSIQNEVINAQFTYENEDITASGSYTRNASDGSVTSIGGSVNKSDADGNSVYLCSFSGGLRNGVIKYTTSEITKEDYDDVWAAITDIENHVTADVQEGGAA